MEFRSCEVLFKKNEKLKNFFNKFFSLDFGNDNGKLCLSRGQLTSCVLIGGAGYFGSSKDRGKQNFLETLYRYPLVGFYIICGNELLEKGFKKLLYKTGHCKEVLNEKLEVPRFDELKEYVKKFEGNEKELYKKEAYIDDVNWLLIDDLEEPMKVKVKTRYSTKEADATISKVSYDEYKAINGKFKENENARNKYIIKIEFDEPQARITPGQSSVFYLDDIVVGGGKII